MCVQFASFINMYLLLCIGSRLFSHALLIPVGSHWFCLFFIDIHWFSYVPVAHLIIHTIILYIGRLALDVQQVVPNIRQWTSKSNASLICTHRYVLFAFVFVCFYWCILVLDDFSRWFWMVFNDIHWFLKVPLAQVIIHIQHVTGIVPWGWWGVRRRCVHTPSKIL